MKKLREEVVRYGIQRLTNEELLQLILGTGGNMPAALTVKPLQHLLGHDASQLRSLYGLGPAKAIQLQAVLEFARRIMRPVEDEAYRIACPQDVATLVMGEMAFLEQEQLRVLVLNTKHLVLANLVLYTGTLNSSVVRIAEVFRPAMTRGGSGIVVCHNHPSGDPTPSPEDLDLTHHCIEAGKLLEIDLVDHVIIGDYRFVSLKEQLRWS